MPGGVFGVLPSAAVEARVEVAGATEEGVTSRGSASQSDERGGEGVAGTFSQPLAAIDEVTGGVIPPALVLAGLAAMAAALGLGIRREIRRW